MWTGTAWQPARGRSSGLESRPDGGPRAARTAAWVRSVGARVNQASQVSLARMTRSACRYSAVSAKTVDGDQGSNCPPFAAVLVEEPIAAQAPQPGRCPEQRLPGRPVEARPETVNREAVEGNVVEQHRDGQLGQVRDRGARLVARRSALASSSSPAYPPPPVAQRRLAWRRRDSAKRWRSVRTHVASSGRRTAIKAGAESSADATDE